jgi:large subunit ribosomal protein L17
MHRHGYQGKKFNRERDQRSALIKGLADSLIRYQKIETTLPKAKELVPYVEKLITKAKKGDLHNRRLIIKSLQTLEASHRLVDQIAPKLNSRVSGHLRITRTRTRRGDNAQLATVTFVDDLVSDDKITQVAAAPEGKSSKSSSTSSTPTPTKPKKSVAKESKNTVTTISKKGKAKK